LHTEELINLNSLPNIVAMIRGRWGVLGEHIAHLKFTENPYKVRPQNLKRIDHLKYLV